jgi:4-hydroxythreonine-4-phosphate dehydrogenase
MKPVIAISLGDANGVGPEVILKSFLHSDLLDVCRPGVFGSAAAFAWHHARNGAGIRVQPVARATDASEGAIAIVDTGGEFDAGEIGTPTARSGAMSLDAIRAGYEAVTAGDAEALVTAPISKEAIALAGSPHRGHTELLASFAPEAEGVIMIMAGNTMKVGLVTAHIPLAQVAARITRARVFASVRAAHRGMERDFGVRAPHIAVLALNPHASDGGYLGTEERDEIAPAVADARAAGLSVDGPFPADGFFSAHNKQFYDIVVAMYHDQGLIPFKMQARGRGVNVSSGLPIVRTSPDHGTAFDIAGLGLAEPDSMREAIRVARTIALHRRDAAGA